MTVSYSVQYPPRDEYPCGVKQPPIPNPSVPVLIPAGASAYKVMETAVSDYGASYKFTATYFGSALGYLIDAINNVPVAVTQVFAIGSSMLSILTGQRYHPLWEFQASPSTAVDTV